MRARSASTRLLSSAIAKSRLSIASIACTSANKGPLSFTHYRCLRSANAFQGLCNEHSQSCALHHRRLAVGHAVVVSCSANTGTAAPRIADRRSSLEGAIAELRVERLRNDLL